MKTEHNFFRSQDQFEVLDVHQLFTFYNSYFFEGVLQKCTVEWSERMTLCAGSCANTYGISCVIKLSSPLLKFRTANEVKETLIHQMIHAFLFITNPRACIHEGGHGKQFKDIMNSINTVTGLNITVFHNFNDEVNLYRKHIWRCDGPCQTRPPFFGYVKRAMNRRPQPADRWFSDHQSTCGGNFIKMSGPPQLEKKPKGERKLSKGKGKRLGGNKSIEDYFKKADESSKEKPKMQGNNQKSESNYQMREKPNISPFSGIGKSLQDLCKEEQQNQSNNIK